MESASIWTKSNRWQNHSNVQVRPYNLSKNVAFFETFYIFTDCEATESIWICVTCGALNCGRYIKGHGLAHYKGATSPGHSVCMDTQELSVFW